MALVLSITFSATKILFSFLIIWFWIAFKLFCAISSFILMDLYSEFNKDSTEANSDDTEKIFFLFLSLFLSSLL